MRPVRERADMSEPCKGCGDRVPLSVSCEVCGRGADGAVILCLDSATDSFVPDWVSPPGDTIADIVGERELDAAEVAKQLGLSEPEFGDLLLGATLTDELAEKLAAVLGGTAQFWRTREQQYRDGLKRQRLK
jgi:plasmid maintenance system antidote protein VapI